MENKIRIVYFYQYFGTSKGGWSTRVYEMCKRWVEAGHEVTVVTTPYDKSDIPRFKGISKTFYYDGIKVIVLNFPTTNKTTVFKRISGFLKFVFVGFYYLFKLRFDVAVASSGPITVGILGIFAKKIRRKKFVFEVRDLWPAGSIQLDVLKGKTLIRILYWFENLCYKNADLIVACSEGMKQDIADRYHYNHIIVVPNASDTELFAKPQTIQLPEKYKGKRLVIYTGSLGVIDECMQILHAAKHFDIKAYPDVLFLIIGTGVDKDIMEAYIQKEQLHHVEMLGLLPKADLVVYLQQSFVSLLTIRDIPILHACSPNKIFDSFAASVPIIQNTHGWIKTLVDKEQCGLNAHIGYSNEIAEAIAYYLENPDIRDQHAINAYRLACTTFSRDKCAAFMLQSICELVKPVPSKNVWVINQFSGHASSGWGERHFFMSSYWKARGYNVSIISGSFNHMFLNLPNAPEKYNFETSDGIDFCWVRTPRYNPKSVKRFWSMIVFAWRVYRININKVSRPDAIVVSSMPIFPILTGYLLKKKYGAKKLIFEIRDIWPLTLIELGETSEYHPITQFIGWFENFGYRNSDHIVTLLPYAAKHILAHGGSPQKICYIPNGLDEKALKRECLSNDIKAMLPKGKFVIGYTGTHNLGNALEYLVEAAIMLQKQADVYFVLVGDGYRKDDLVSMAAHLPNISFIPKIPKQQIQDMLQHFDVCFVGRNNSHLFDFGISGNKYFDYMMAGKPILDSNNSKGGPAELGGCGLLVEAESAVAIAEGILTLKQMTTGERNEMGLRGRDFLQKNHSMKYLAEKYIALFQ